jgi:DnaK suppressor protein
MSPNTLPAGSSAPDPRPSASREDLRRMLEECRYDRERLLAQLAPVAAPHLDPVAYVQAQAARATVVQIQGALSRILDGTYGLCVRCGDPIPDARLEIRPYTDSCVGCQDPLTAGR